ncbi:hypothetical protein ACQJBY_012921 [Aegilops geniculata]
MADMILGSAQGAVDSLLGRLTSALVDEAQLLGGIRRDVQFIKDEMESMNGFLLHVAEAGEEDHQVGAWMKQVAEVAYASQNSVDRYIQSIGAGRRQPGLLGYLSRLPKLVWTLPTRHRIANQIRELKIRACEVGERRMRYDVKVPNNINSDSSYVKKAAGWQAAGNDDTINEEEDAERRYFADFRFINEKMHHYWEDILPSFLKDVGEYHGLVQRRNLKVIAVVGMGSKGKSYEASMAYKDPSVVASFDCKAWIFLGKKLTEKARILGKILAELELKEKEELIAQPQAKEKEAELIALIQLHLKGKRFLLVIEDVRDNSLWDCIKSAFPHESCSPGSSIVITTHSIDVAQSFFPNIIMDLDTGNDWYVGSAMGLMNINSRSELQPILREIVSKPLPVGLFLRALYVNPNRTKADLQSLCDKLDNSTTPSSSNNARQLLKFCNLTSNCKNCLLHLSNFPQDTIFKRTRLVRRWAIEGMIAKRGRLSALDEADHCFDLLVTHGFLEPADITITGKVKSCKMRDIIPDIVTHIAREDHFVNNNHLPDLAHRLSVHYEGQPQAETELSVTPWQACWNICGHQATVEQSNATQVILESFPSSSQVPQEFLESLPSSSQVNRELLESLRLSSQLTREFLESLPSSSHSGILQVLDLENCNELKDHHLKNICNHVFHLKYLSLRKTGITELPKQLNKLQSLEILDIRETKVEAFAKKSVFLPKLKHLLAGQWTDEELVVSGNIQSNKKFSTVAMPKYIGDMTELQVISHIAVSGDGSELKYVGNLLQLVKLGVFVSGSKTSSVLRHLYHATGNLGFLRSLSIQVTENSKENENMNNDGANPVYPKYLHTLKISGLKNGLPSWIAKLKVLTKMTLHMTSITDNEFQILGWLTSLSWLRLQEESCNGSTLTFEKDAFQSLKFLGIECSVISSINFDNEACLRLNKLAWSSTGKQTLSGIESLPRLKKLELTGEFNKKSVKKAIKENTNKPIFVGNLINA